MGLSKELEWKVCGQVSANIKEETTGYSSNL